MEQELTFKRYEPDLLETEVVLIDEDIVLEAQSLITACEGCDKNAETSFDCLLDAITDCDPSRTEYLICRPAKCPQCFRAVTEKSLITPR